MSRTAAHTPEQINGLIQVFGSAYKAAIAIKITPSAFYDQMRTHGIKRIGHKPIDGEPKAKTKKKTWLKSLIAKHENNLCAVARELGISRSAVVSRMESYGIKNPHPDRATRRKDFVVTFMTHQGNVNAVATALGVTPSAVYDRMRRYQLVSR